ncbi:hypothetical protein BMF94_6063 [Rhodotorula taiwanensis]|uniref:DDH domain-containing protein n=1 Tax=Rhodotorula taiwanensis TaxID=741276 RepID=A0A2S5B2A4_9BASI|nr:hypothetical protein BMF94_6063 [Rhodotorula taiwanensis]
MRSTALLLSATALLSAVLIASPLERNTVVFAEPNVQAVLSDSPTDLWQQSFQAESSVDEYWDEQDELATGDGDDDDEGSTGTGHLSQWSRQNKEDFIADLKNNDADDWIIVMGNEAGDLDSLVSAMALSYMYNHLDKPQKAVALLQTEQGAQSPGICASSDNSLIPPFADALDLRPENALALHYARMSSGHRDLLTIDELPIKPNDLWHRIKGIALVDHNVPRAIWDKAEIVAIIDHHDDRGVANETANPRIVELAGSCSSLVTRYLLDQLPGASSAYPIPTDAGELEVLDTDPVGAEAIDLAGEPELNVHGPLPKELIELILRTIAIDTDALKKDSSKFVDRYTASRLFPRSSWKHRKMKDVMSILDDDMTQSRKALGGLDLRSLLRRDWKGDSIQTKSKKYPSISIGFASAPVSLEEQIERTPEKTVPEWFAWTSEIQADVTVALSNFKDKKTGEKYRQLALVVAHGYGRRLHAGSADRLFRQLKDAVESAGIKGLDKWHRPDKKALLPRRAVYQYQSADASRKFWRPKIEQAVKEWRG